MGTTNSVNKIYMQSVVEARCSPGFAKIYLSKVPMTAVDVLHDRVMPFNDEHGVMIEHALSNNGPERTAHLLRKRLQALGVTTLFIELGGPRENGHAESCNGKLRDEPLDREIFETLAEAPVLIERRWNEYNTIRPHRALRYLPPTLEAIQPLPAGSASIHSAARAQRVVEQMGGSAAAIALGAPSAAPVPANNPPDDPRSLSRTGRDRDAKCPPSLEEIVSP